MEEISKDYGVQPEVRDQIKLRDKAASGDMLFVVTPATTTRAATAAAFTRTVTVHLETAAGEIHNWFSKAITSGVSVGDTSIAGAASIVPATTLTFVNGVATVVLTGTAAAWLEDETNTVTAAQATILGYTIAAATSVETISA